MAESVDALVSNTSEAIHPGSIRVWVLKTAVNHLIFSGFAFVGSQRV